MRTAILVRLYPIDAEDEARVVEKSGGAKYSPTPGHFVTCRDSRGQLVSVPPVDVMGVVGG